MFKSSQFVEWGFHPIHQSSFFEELAKNENLVPARVVFSSHEQYRILVMGESKERWAKARGRFHSKDESLPVVGDWVLIEINGDDHEHLPIEIILPRLSCLKRQSSRTGGEVLASNLSHVGLVTSFNYDLKERRLERGIAMVESGGAKPFVVVNKMDQIEKREAESLMERLSERLPGIPLFSCSALNGEGLDEIMALFKVGETVTLLGMSGVGKSTLINSVLGLGRMKTTEIRDDDSRGRHTTTHRELIFTEKGFWLMDTPGIREFSYAGDEEGLEVAFGDITKLMTECRYGNCTHGNETGCAITAALESGNLPNDRWLNFLKLSRELEFHENKHDKAYHSQKRKEWAKRHSDVRKRLKFERGE